MQGQATRSFHYDISRKGVGRGGGCCWLSQVTALLMADDKTHEPLRLSKREERGRVSALLADVRPVCGDARRRALERIIYLLKSKQQ